MANKVATGLDARDQRFAERLAKRDESVLVDIDQAYSQLLRRILAQRRGRYLGRADVDDILQLALMAVWTNFDAAQGMNVRQFYFHVGRKRCIDAFRKSERRDKLYEKLIAAGCVPGFDDSSSIPLNEQVEADRNLATLMGLVNKAVARLTRRQRLAFQRRFLGDRSCWAKELEEETGVPAKQWRKASVEARIRVAEFLKDNGVRYSEEGGHYELEKARTTA